MPRFDFLDRSDGANAGCKELRSLEAVCGDAPTADCLGALSRSEVMSKVQKEVQSLLRVAAYGRYSTDQQRPASIEDQFRNCRRCADTESFPIAMYFADEAITGATRDRPQYQAMLAAAARGEIDVLLVDDLSRLSRDQVESEQVIRRLEFHGVRIIAVSDGYDSRTKTATRKIQRGVKNLINEMRLDELREQVHRGLTGQAMKHYWCGGRPFGYRLKPILDPSNRDAYGNPSRIGTVLEIDKDQAKIVLEIYTRFAKGLSYFAIARDLNERAVPSPGSSWKRRVRRCRGWVGSAIRVILRNPLYTGHVRWNVSQFVRDPDSGSYQRRRRSEAEWVHHHDEALRIVSDELFGKARARLQQSAARGSGIRTGRNVKFLLSGFLVCGSCGANYVMGDAHKYVCSSYTNGRACSNGVRVRRDKLEKAVFGPILTQLTEPDRVRRMASEMRALFERELKDKVARTDEIPRELRELDSRLERLRRRLVDGDPDIPPDELQFAIDRAEAKRRQLQMGLTEADIGAGARVASAVAHAAALYDLQVSRGLEGDPEASTEARLILKELIPDRIRLMPRPDGTLWAKFGLQPAALLSAVAGERGRGDRI